MKSRGILKRLRKLADNSVTLDKMFVNWSTFNDVKYLVKTHVSRLSPTLDQHGFWGKSSLRTAQRPG